MTKPIVILPFQPENQEDVKKLILAGLVEHWGKLDPTKNPDLNDIANSYAQSVFFVAWEGKKSWVQVPWCSGPARLERL